MSIESATNDPRRQYIMEEEILLSASYPRWTCAVMNKGELPQFLQNYFINLWADAFVVSVPCTNTIKRALVCLLFVNQTQMFLIYVTVMEKAAAFQLQFSTIDLTLKCSIWHKSRRKGTHHDRTGDRTEYKWWSQNWQHYVFCVC